MPSRALGLPSGTKTRFRAGPKVCLELARKLEQDKTGLGRE